MYPWLAELLARWRREGRRPSSMTGREAEILLRSSHVRDTTQDEELMHPIGLHEVVPDEQLLRAPRNGGSDEQLLRVPVEKRKE